MVTPKFWLDEGLLQYEGANGVMYFPDSMDDVLEKVRRYKRKGRLTLRVSGHKHRWEGTREDGSKYCWETPFIPVEVVEQLVLEKKLKEMFL